MKEVKGSKERFYSATSFCQFLESDFVAWMERLKLESPDHPLVAKECELGVGQVFINQGLLIEEKLLEWLRLTHPAWKIVDLSEEINSLRRSHHSNWRELAAKETLQVLERNEADVIYQAPLYHEELKFYGIADFLLRPNKSDFVIWDTKLAKHPQGTGYHLQRQLQQTRKTPRYPKLKTKVQNPL